MAHSYHSSTGDVAARSSSSSNAFQMPSYTSHTSRGPGASSPGRSKKTRPFFGDFSASSISPGKSSRLPASKASSQLDSDQSLLEMLSSTVACLKQKHMDLEALGCLEQSLWLKRRMFGVDNSVVQRALNEVVLSYNSVAMQYLAQAQFDQCLAMLRKAEAITAPGNFKKCQSLQILTFNNIGCCYRKLGKLKSALKYLKEAAQIGSTCAHVKNLSITHLNLCAIQSQLGRHDLALEHAQAAIFHTQEELVSMEAAQSNGNDSRDEDGDCEGDGSMDVLDAKSREEKIISLAVAYHNLAVELEFNGRGEASLQWYKKALQLVWKYRDSNAALCASFKKIFMDAKKKLEMQRTGGNGNSNSSNNTMDRSSKRPSSNNGRASQQSTTTNSVSSRSYNALSGGDRKKPIARPKSAHYQSSRSGGGGAIAPAASDLSYSANVASQCYKPTKPSSAGLQYASPPKVASQSRRGSGGVQSRAAAPRPSSATSSRQRPLSASAARSSSAKHGATGGAGGASGDLDLGPSIEAHWKKLEKEFSIESSNSSSGSNATARNNSSSQQQQQYSRAAASSARRPQSARPTRSSSQSQQQRPSLNQYGDLGLNGDEDDDDCDVIDDDEPSENENELEDDLDCEQSDDFADLLLRRDEKQGNKQLMRSNAEAQDSQQQQLSGRGLRHRQALDEARRKANAFESENEDGDEGTISTSASVNGDGEEENDLPNQRVSHMEYLRRMKRLAENIKDDLTGNPPVPAVAINPLESGPSFTQQRKMPRCPVSTTTSGHSGTNANSSFEKEIPDAATAARRGSMSKVRERLERVRNESFENLPKYEGANDDEDEVSVVGRTAAVEKGDMGKPEVDRQLTAKQEEFVEIVEDSTIFYTTEHEISLAEQNLIRMAAAKYIQAFLREERARANARERRQQLRENQVALQIQAQAKQFVQNAKDQRLELEQELLAQSQQLEIENLAASAIQQLYRQKFLPNDSSSTQPLPSLPSRRQSEPRATISDSKAPDSSRQRDSAAVVIQATMKGFFTRELVTEHRAAQLSRQYVERKHIEIALDHAMAREQTFLEQLSATKIQALVRGRQSRFLFEAAKIGLNAAATKIQGSFRLHHRHLQSSTDVGVRSVAARSIQQMVRSFLHRQSHLHQTIISGELSEVQHIAATSLQRFWRQAAARRELLLEELEAATCIQALGRGHLARKSFQSLLESSSQVGLSKPSSAFSISAVTADASEEGQEQLVGMTGEIGSGRPNAINLSFLPAAVREMYLEFVNLPSYPDARAAAGHQQKANGDNDRQEVTDLGLTFDDLMLELETCGDVATAYFALNALRMLVLLDDEERHLTLTNAIKVARVTDQRIQDQEIWSHDVQQASLWLLDAFHDVLLAGI